MSENKIYSLIFKSLTGQLSADQRRQLKEWTSASQENHDLREEIGKVWELSKNSTPTPPQLDMDEEFSIFQRKLEARKKKPLIRKIGLFRIAASIAIVLAAALWWFAPTSTSTPRQITSTAPAVQELQLQDGTEVVLNTGSTLQYPEQFSTEKRQVRLSGEAYFDVEHAPQQPFEIDLNIGLVEVLGTSFTIRNLPEEDTAEITVESGKVRFAFPEGTPSWSLQAGDRLLIDKANTQAQVIKDPNLNGMAWYSGQLLFDDTKIDRALHDLERFFNIKIEQLDDKLDKCSISTTLPVNSLEKMLETLHLLFDAEIIEVDEKNYQIKGGKC